MSEIAHPALTTKTAAARVLFENRDPFLSEWMRRVKAEVPAAAKLTEPILINTIPLFLDKLAATLCEEENQELTVDSSNLALEHGGERARITRYGPEQLMQEYIILRSLVLEKLNALVPLGQREVQIIQNATDFAVQEAMVAYFLIHGRIREQFVATLTHDLRNPIGAVKGAAEEIHEVLSEGLNEASIADMKDLCERILRSTRRADRMIQDLLDSSLVQTGEALNLHLCECDIENIVRNAVSEMPTKMRSRLKIICGSISGWWDPEALQRSTENLVTNAFKYGDATQPVTVSVSAAHGRIMIAVHNFGNPIPAESRETIFQVFRRSRSAQAGAVKGWGIGLALARTTAERLGGSLGVESSFEQGTTFTIDVPIDARPFQTAPDSSGG